MRQGRDPAQIWAEIGAQIGPGNGGWGGGGARSGWAGAGHFELDVFHDPGLAHFLKAHERGLGGGRALHVYAHEEGLRFGLDALHDRPGGGHAGFGNEVLGLSKERQQGDAGAVGAAHVGVGGVEFSRLESLPEAIDQGGDFGRRRVALADPHDGAVAHEAFDDGGRHQPLVAQLDEAEEDGFFLLNGREGVDAGQIAVDAIRSGGEAPDFPSHSRVVALGEHVQQDLPQAGRVQFGHLELGGHVIEVLGGEFRIFRLEVRQAFVQQVLAHAAQVGQADGVFGMALGEKAQVGIDQGGGDGVGRFR